MRLILNLLSDVRSNYVAENRIENSSNTERGYFTTCSVRVWSTACRWLAREARYLRRRDKRGRVSRGVRAVEV